MTKNIICNLQKRDLKIEDSLFSNKLDIGKWYT